MSDPSRMIRSRQETKVMHDSDSATSSEIGDNTEVDDYDFLEFLGDWSESIMFENVADEIDYGESSRFKDFEEESASFKKRRVEDNQSTMRLNSNTLLMKISAEDKPRKEDLMRKSLLKGEKNALNGERTTPNSHYGLNNPVEIIFRGPDDLKLEIIPEKLYQAFNGGNLKLVSQIISSSFAQDCIFQTMLMDTPLIGRQVCDERSLL